jgi:hypothetical protein
MHFITQLRATLRGGLMLAGTGLVAVGNPPKGWFQAGSKPADYEMTVDATVVHGGQRSATLKCTAASPAGFGTLTQELKAARYLGKRVRFSGYVRAQDVTGWAGLWMRVDGKDGTVLSFDNMHPRAIKGTNDWMQYHIVLDVPVSSEMIAFGLLLNGSGQVWMDDLRMEVVGEDVPTTDYRQDSGLPKAPKFELP